MYDTVLLILLDVAIPVGCLMGGNFTDTTVQRGLLGSNQNNKIHNQGHVSWTNIDEGETV